MTDKRNTQLDVVDSVQGEKPALKRTKHIDLGRMRKGFSVKPLALGVASVILSGCGGEKEDATIYTSLEDCKHEFGPNQCQYVNNSSGSFFMPFMAGYMVSSLLSPNRYYSQPLYTSYSYNSPFRSRWITADGYVFDGDIRKRKYRVNKDVYKPKPTVNRTMKRGGFGSSVRAKSSWGSSSRKGGWGG